jgi:NAD(P)-dependent dehydrogenase (short-subunit alcohol dehydrogenase family)
MKIIVITGSTSGIGLGLADAFLARDCAVTVSGHSQINLTKLMGYWLANTIKAGYRPTFVM